MAIWLLHASNDGYAEEIFGLRLEASYWDANIKGRIQSQGVAGDDQPPNATRFSPFEMGITDEKQRAITLELRHRLPIVPRLILDHTTITAQASSTTAREINFRASTFASGAVLQTSMELTQNDYTLYYSLADSWFHFDLGASIRVIEGDLDLTEIPAAADTPGGGEEEGGEGELGGETGTLDGPSTDLAAFGDEPILLFTRAALTLPETTISIVLTTRYLNSGQEHWSDHESKITALATSDTLDFAFHIGYKKTKLISKDLGELETNIEIAGPFLRFGLIF